MAQTFLLDPAIDTTASEIRPQMRSERKGYIDRQFKGGQAEWEAQMAQTSTVYVGNLSYYTTEYQLYELFSRCGSIKRVIMGLDKNKKTPCGFCFVEFEFRSSALKSIELLNGVSLDARDIKVNLDAGFQEGRQFGRGSGGGQAGDEKRGRRDPGQDRRSGGFGAAPSAGFGVLTRSITVVSCIAIIAVLMIACQPNSVHGADEAESSTTTAVPFNGRRFSRNQYMNPLYVRQAQLSQYRQQFEKQFAQLLVTVMKAAKPTLLKAFIKATLADKQLKDVALAIFFNNTSSDSDTL